VLLGTSINIGSVYDPAPLKQCDMGVLRFAVVSCFCIICFFPLVVSIGEY